MPSRTVKKMLRKIVSLFAEKRAAVNSYLTTSPIFEETRNGQLELRRRLIGRTEVSDKLLSVIVYESTFFNR